LLHIVLHFHSPCQSLFDCSLSVLALSNASSLGHGLNIAKDIDVRIGERSHLLVIDPAALPDDLSACLFTLSLVYLSNGSLLPFGHRSRLSPGAFKHQDNHDDTCRPHPPDSPKT